MELAGSSARLEDIPSDGGDTTENDENDPDNWKGGSVVDPFKGYPILSFSNDFDCRNLLVDVETGNLNSVGKLIDDVFTVMKWLGPLLAIILSVLDFIKFAAVPSAKPKVIKRTVIRIVIGLIVLFLPYLLDLLFHLFGLYDISRCKIGG